MKKKLLFDFFFVFRRKKVQKHILVTCINLCLGIDVSKPKQEELDIYDTMQLYPKLLYLRLKRFGSSISGSVNKIVENLSLSGFYS